MLPAKGSGMEFIMKALSILPYYAMEIMEGYKTIEWRSCKTDYRGTIVICSSSRKEHRCIAGHALCLADIVDIVPFKKKHLKGAEMEKIPNPAGYAWILDNVRPIVPVPAKGKIHLWEFEGEIKLIDDLEFKDEEDEKAFWDWYDSLQYLSPRGLKYEREHPDIDSIQETEE